MGGRGSGTWHRWNAAATVEDAKRIDVRWMQRNGYLNPGSAGSLSWTLGGEPSGYINYWSSHDSLYLNYRVRAGNDETWTPVEQSILIERTSCHLVSAQGTTWIVSRVREG